MISVLRCLFAATLLLEAQFISADRSHAQSAASGAGAPEQAQIYLLRGLFGIYSLGMDSLAAKLKQQGNAAAVWNWTDAPLITDRIITSHRQGDTAHIVLIGHSLGSNAVIQIADRLKIENIPVDLVVTFDVTEELTVPNNVARFINFYQRNGFGRAAKAEPGFQGEFGNIDLTSQTSLNHGNIDEAQQLQSFVMERVSELTHTHVRTVQARRKGKRS